jgi:hypothetical protein
LSFIKLDRKLLTWGWKDKPNMVALWIEILLQANYYENEWHGKVYEVGSFPTSVAKLSASTGLTTQQVRTCLKNLESTNEITITTTSQGTKINVTKWADYQSCDDDDNKRSNKQGNKQLTNDQQTINNTIRNKEVKKEKNTKNITSLYAPSSAENEAVARIPLNITDTYYLIFQEDIDHYKELYPAVDVEQEIRSMVGWCEANPNNRKTKGGVKRFIANWLNKSQNRTRAYSTQAKKGDEIFYDTN